MMSHQGHIELELGLQYQPMRLRWESQADPSAHDTIPIVMNDGVSRTTRPGLEFPTV